MDNRTPPKPLSQVGPPNKSEAQEKASNRHRFGEGEKTTIMPLAEILRARGQAPKPVGPATASDDFASEKTQIATVADIMRTVKPTSSEPQDTRKATPSGPSPLSQKTVAVALSDVVGRPPATPSSEQKAPATQLRTAQSAPSASAASSAPKTPNKGAAPQLAKVVDEVLAEVGRAPTPTVERPQLTAQGSRRVINQVTVFFSCKGGSGSTALSLNMAHAAAREGHSVCLVDLDLQLGDALAAFGLQPKFTIAQAALACSRGEKLGKNMLPEHSSGVRVLSQVGNLDELDQITSETMAKLVEDLRSSFDTIVVDGVRDFGDTILAVLDVADKIAITTVQEVLAIRRARWSFSILRKVGFDPKDITVVINRFEPQSDIPLDAIRQMFEPALVITVPRDATLVTQSLNRGVPLLELKRAHPVTQRVSRLCDNLMYDEAPADEDTPSTEASRVGLFARMFGRKKTTVTKAERK